MAALRESSRKSEGLKECEGTPSSFFVSLLLHFYNFLLILHDLFLLLLPALHGDKQKLLGVVEEMKILVYNNNNRAEEVITRAEDDLARAQLIRLGAD
jgi:hypothetical protein